MSFLLKLPKASSMFVNGAAPICFPITSLTPDLPNKVFTFAIALSIPCSNTLNFTLPTAGAIILFLRLASIEVTKSAPALGKYPFSIFDKTFFSFSTWL